jgi:hypothetical protein
MTTKKKHAWLLAWEASTPDRLAAIKGHRIMAFIDHRRSDASVRDMIFALYLAFGDLLPREKLSFALNRETRDKMFKQDAVSLRCGFNPDVVARKVHDVEIETLDCGSSIIRWKQPQFRFIDGSWQITDPVQQEETVEAEMPHRGVAGCPR